MITRPAEWLWMGLAVALSLGLVRALNPSEATYSQWAVVLNLSTLPAYAVAHWFARRVADDYPAGSAMRLGWLLMAASAAAAVVRHGFEALAVPLWHPAWATIFLGIRQIPFVLSLILLFAALAAMWSSYASLGLGASLRTRDVFFFVVIVAMVGGVLWGRSSMADSVSVYPAVRYMQYASPVLLATPAALGVMLFRVSREVGEGRLATSLRYLVLLLTLRLLLLLLGALPGPHPPAISFLQNAAGWTVAWLFGLAVAYRWEVTVDAIRLSLDYPVTPARGAKS